jgi:hypothetical protein
MRRFWTTLVFAVSTSLTLAAAPATQPAAGDWISLFNGQNLDGWKAAGDGNFAVVDGAILAEGTNRQHGWLISDREFGDFVLKLRFRWERGDTGVQFRSKFDGKDMVGYQADLDLSNPDTTGTLHEQGGRQMLQHTLVNGQTICDVNGWNDYEVYAVGDHIQLFINGVKTADFNDSKEARGILAFQAHAGQLSRVFYKDIRVLPLRPGNAWRPLFNGRDLSSFKQTGEERWTVEAVPASAPASTQPAASSQPVASSQPASCIVGRSGPKAGYGWLVTTEEYGDFLLRLKFRWHAGNSGVQFRSWIEEGHMHGYQADIDPTVKAMTGALYDEREEGTLAPASPEAEAALKKDDWNTYEVSAIGNHIQLFINGVRSVDARHGRTPRGIIALQVHSGGPVHIDFADVQILDLNAPPTTQPQ